MSPRILMLILASDTAPEYREFQEIWRVYMTRTPGVDCYFYKGDPALSQDSLLEGDTLHIKIDESLSHVYEKMMRAFQYFEPVLSNYDFVFRTNLSSYLDIPAYREFCSTLPRSGVYSGVVGSHGGISFASGAGFTMTPDLIRRLVAEHPPEVYLDDVSIGAAVQRWGIPVLPAPRLDLSSSGKWILHRSPYAGPVFHRRIKTDHRETDVQTLQTLVRQHYGTLHSAEYVDAII